MAVYLSLRVGVDTPESLRLWTENALPTLRHNRKLMREVVGNSKEYEVRTPAGLIVGKRKGVPLDSRSHHFMIERITRGLYFHHYGEALGNRVELEVQWLSGIPRGMEKLLAATPHIVVGNNQFEYRYGHAEEDELHSVWVYCFYGKHMASCFTAPSNHSLQARRP